MTTMNNVIETNNLHLQLGKKQILSNVNLKVPQGSIYSFLGPNGAGKTSCIKMLTNLIQPQKKEVFLLGKDITQHRIQIMKRIGTFIESPSLFSHLTGRENLEIARRAYSLPKNSIDRVLDLVHMKADANYKSKTYSLGMRQRIAIAMSLIHEPELLILDEPTNGLDPSGIHEIRELLIRLNQKEGKTIFISSHLLSEIQKTSSHVGILNHGKMIFQGELNDLKELQSNHLKIRVDRADQAALFLAQQSINAKRVNGQELQIKLQKESDAMHINKLLIQNQFNVLEFSSEKKDLEEVFLSITE